ncbi:MAG: deoxyribonuclease IV [Halanaeroarchaeum sp.]
MRIGAHVSVAGGVDNAVGRQRDVGGNCGQIFTHSPQVWQEPNLEEAAVAAFREGSTADRTGPWVIHASYLVNLATPRSDLRDRSIESMQAELDAARTLGVEYVNVHLGAHTGAGVDAGLDNATSAIDELDVPDGVSLLIESDAGAGTKLGGDFAELGAVLDRVETDLGVCLDTAHTFTAGYDLSSPGAVAETLGAFEEEIGLETLACVHLNDSKHERGTRKDEHAHLGEGEIGDEGIEAIVTHEALRDLPFVLETPTEDGRSFAWNVEKARSLRAE